MKGSHVALIVGAVAVLALLLFMGQREDADATAGVNPRVGTGNFTVFLFEDYQCGHCQSYSLGAAHQHLMDQWVTPGHVTVVYKHVAFVGPYSPDAARASQCVYRTDAAMWPAWDHAVYAYARNGGQPSAENLYEITRDHGIDTGAYSACLRSPAGLDGQIDVNADEFDAAGARGTPSIIIDGQVLNPNDVVAVDAAIEEALGRA